MIRHVVFLFLLFASLSSHAAAPVQVFGTNGQTWLDGDIACKSTLLAYYPSARNYIYNGVLSGSARCTYQWTIQDDSYGNVRNWGVVYNMLCEYPLGAPPNKTLPLAEQCANPPPVCKAGQKWVIRVIVTPTNAGNYPKNYNGCAVTLVQVLRCYTSGAINYCSYEMAYTGAVAGPETTDTKNASDTAPPTGERTPVPPAPPPDGKGGTCPVGTVQAGYTASGMPICIGRGTDAENPKPPGDTTIKPPVTTTTPEGNSQTVDEVVRNNDDGSQTTTTTTTTTKVDGSKTISQKQTTTNSTLGKPGLSDEGKKGKGFCQENPNLSICRESLVGGECEAISCSGDAVQCATLRAVAATECRAAADRKEASESTLTALGEGAMAGNDPESGNFPKLANAKIINAGTLDQNGFLGNRSCFTDKVVTVMGKPVTIPFSKACDALLALRFVMMIIASLVSFRMLSGVILH